VRTRFLQPEAGARAVVLDRRPLVYVDGPDPALDRPAHVRAASAVVAIGDELVVVQDDAHFLARVTAARVDALALPPGPGGLRLFGDDRGNKALKLDLEAAVVVDGAVVALGSGSTARRERLVLVPWPHGAPRIVEAPALYAALRGALPPGVELNVEGAVVVGDRLRLLQRGNGLGALDALLDVDRAWLAALVDGGEPGDVVVRDVEALDLGHLGGVRLTPTDVTGIDGRLLLTAAAEASPDATRDGEVVGAAIAWIEGDGGGWAPLVDADGRALADKIEGIAPAPAGELWLVTDVDDVSRPAELLRARLERG
jgi:hypothetical protein